MGQTDNPSHTVFLIGDTGKDTVRSKAVDFLKEELKLTPNATVLFLGDNVYMNGLHGNLDHPETEYISQKRMRVQLEIFKKFNGRVYMIPGNHDWNKSLWNGKKRIIEEGNYVEEYLKKNTTVLNRNEGAFFPKDALPGPVSVKLEKNLRMIFVDTQWWLQSQFFHPVGKLQGMSKKETGNHFIKQLDSLLVVSKHNNERVILAVHHPLYSVGSHGKSREPWRFLFNYTPLQLFGILGINRFLIQDIPQPRYQRMKKKLLSVIEKYDNLLYVSGHDHNLQFSKQKSAYHIISGAGSLHVSTLSSDPSTLFANKENGFFKLSCFEGGRILVEAFGVDKKGVLFSYWIE